MIECPICNRKFKQLTKQHLDTHNISVTNFKKQFPNIYIGNNKLKEYTNKLKEKYTKQYYKQPNTCKQCCKMLSYKQRNNKFCSQSCAANYNNRKKCNSKKCLNCNKILNNRQYKFCSNKCQQKYYFNKRIEQVLETGILHKSGIRGLGTYKKILITLRGHRCEICGLSEQMKQPIPLILDHINGNSDDGQLENCRLVCGNCDMQLPTYKAKNRGNGRYQRVKRYKEGKSY